MITRESDEFTRPCVSEITNSAGVARIRTVRVGRLNDLSFGRYGKSGSKTTRMVEFMAFEREKCFLKLEMLHELQGPV